MARKGLSSSLTTLMRSRGRPFLLISCMVVSFESGNGDEVRGAPCPCGGATPRPWAAGFAADRSVLAPLRRAALLPLVL